MKNAPSHQWTVDEYIAYLYLSIADADLSIADSELHAIQVKFSRILSNYFKELTIDVGFLLSALQNSIETKSVEEKKEKIGQLHPLFNLQEEVKMQIMTDLQDLIKADNLETLCEYEMVNYIRLCLSKN